MTFGSGRCTRATRSRSAARRRARPAGARARRLGAQAHARGAAGVRLLRRAAELRAQQRPAHRRRHRACRRAPGSSCRRSSTRRSPTQALRGTPAPARRRAVADGVGEVRARRRSRRRTCRRPASTSPTSSRPTAARVFAIAGGKLRALDVTGDTPKLVGSLALAGGGQELFIRGDRALVMSTSYGDVAAVRLRDGHPDQRPRRSSLTEVDISDPAAMTVRRSMTVDGALVDARMTGATARVVVGSSPGLRRSRRAIGRARRAPLGPADDPAQPPLGPDVPALGRRLRRRPPPALRSRASTC